MVLEKVQKQGSDETHEDYFTMEKWWKRKTRPLDICCLTQLYATDVE